MKHYDYKTELVCSQLISFDLDDELKIHNLSFVGGCNGNLKAIGILVEGKDAREIERLLAGNLCRNLPTSCADQLAKAIHEAIN